SGNLKAVITERWQMPSQMPLSYVEPLSHAAARKPGDKEPKDSMAWQFYTGTLDPNKRTRASFLVLVALDVRKLPMKSTKDGKTVIRKGMFDDLDPIDEELLERLAQTTQGCLIGKKRLAALNKRVGERFKMSALEYT